MSNTVIMNGCHRTPPAANAKCIIFTLILALGYWTLPKRNKWILLCLLYAPYLALAWYDYFYQCERSFGPTYLMAFYEWAKPPGGRQRKSYDSWCKDMRSHVLLVDLGVLLILIGFLPDFLAWNP